MSQTQNSSANGPAEPSAARRTALLRLAGLCGLALSGEALAALAAPKNKLPLLAPDLLKLTGVLAELIIPATDTPGALAVGAHHTVDHMLRVCTPKTVQAQFIAGLKRVDAVAKAQGAKSFVTMSPARQAELLTALDAGKSPFMAQDMHFFRQLKQYTLFAYYTSEAGATKELAYLPIPGGFKGNVPLAKNSRTWAL